MNRDEIIKQIQSHGFYASKRDCWIGQTIACGIRTDEIESDHIISFSRLVHLFPTKDGWGVMLPNPPYATNFNQHLSLDDACEIVIGYLSSEHFPMNEKDILTITGSAEGGGFSIMEHTPTGIKRTLFGTLNGKRLKKLNRDQALEEITFEIARKHNG